MMHLLEQAIREWRDWGVCNIDEPPKLMEVFDAGKNHTTALVGCDEQPYVLKIFDHSFEQAVGAQRWAGELGLAPKVYYAKEPVALMDYVAVAVPSMPATARALNKLHRQPPPQAEGLQTSVFDLLGFCDQYLSTADRVTQKQHQALLPLLREYVDDPTRNAFCHNDLVVENCMGSADDTVFIDWEYAQLNNPWFDLAAIILYYELSHEQAREFLDTYRTGWSDKINQRIFITSQISLLWGDLLWHMNKFGHDYRNKNPMRFRYIERLANGLGTLL